MRIGSLAWLWVLYATLASAAPVHHHRRTKGRVCDQRARVSLRALARRAPVGPVARPSTQVQAGLAESAALLQRGHRGFLDDDLAVISNDAPVAQIGADVSLVPAFEPLGLVGRTSDTLPIHDAFSPRSPRGPPPSA